MMERATVGRLPAKSCSVKTQMFFHECGNEVVAVVVALVAVQLQRDIALLARGFEKVRMQLFFEELVREPLVDQDPVRGLLTVKGFDEFRRVVLTPGLLLVIRVPEVIAERFLPPWAIYRAADRRER
jgi:hypothetical protein